MLRKFHLLKQAPAFCLRNTTRDPATFSPHIWFLLSGLAKESELMALECCHLAGFSSEAASRFLLWSRMQMDKFPSLTPLASLPALPGAVSFDRRCKLGTMGDGETGGNHEIPWIPLLVLPLMVQSRSRLPRFHNELESWSDLFLSQLQCLWKGRKSTSFFFLQGGETICPVYLLEEPITATLVLSGPERNEALIASTVQSFRFVFLQPYKRTQHEWSTCLGMGDSNLFYFTYYSLELKRRGFLLFPNHWGNVGKK